MESFLFSKIDERRRYCVPKQEFWDMWHSDKKDAIRRLGFIPRPCGELFGETCKWVVLILANYYPVPEPHKSTTTRALLTETLNDLFEKQGYPRIAEQLLIEKWRQIPKKDTCL